MFVTAFLFGVLTLFYIWLKWNYSFWKRNNVPGPEPNLILGNIKAMFTFSEHWGVVTANWYKKYSNEPYIGIFKMLKPSIVARDPDFIKDVLITNFNSFRANDIYVSKKNDPLLATNPFFSVDDEWRESRKTILPAFTQSKIKNITPVINGVASDFVKYLHSFPANTDFNAKNICVRFTTENVLKCTFSIEAGCFDKEQKSEFLEAGENMFSPSFLVGLKFLAIPILPKWILNLIPFGFVTLSIDRLFRKLVNTNKASRSKDFQSNDILQMLLQSQAKHNFDENCLAGHTLALFMDGTETSSTMFAYALYELALNPHCQEKLFDEITQKLANHDGKLTAEALQEMIYLDGVLYEALRMHPPLLVMTKTCTQKYTLPKTSEQSEPVTIEPGTVINIPVLGVHMDPKNYPEPEEFRPERFNETEQRNRHKGTFLSFGEGPRICLGMRFGMTQVKMALAHIGQNFFIKQSPNHKPIVIDPQTMLSYPRDGIQIRLDSRR